MNNLKNSVAVLITAIILTSCTNEKNEDKYKVLHTGSLPVILETKTGNVYVIVPYDDEKPKIYKRNISEAQ